MAKDFFDTLDAVEKVRAQETVVALTRVMEGWAPRYSCVLPIRIPAIALHNVAIMPQLNILASALIVKLTLWIFGIDDVIDDRRVSLEELGQGLAQRWCRIASGDPYAETDGGDQLAAMLGEIRKELSGYPLFKSLDAEWSAHVRLLIESGVRQYQYALEYEAHGPKALPTLDEYLQNGIYTIGIPWWALTLAIVLDDSSIMKHGGVMEEVARSTSAAVRLYNDVQSLDKELQENNVSSVIIKYHEILDRNSHVTEESALSEAKQYIWQMADSYTQKCYDLTRSTQTKSGQFEAIMHRMAAYNAFFYHGYDYNSTPMVKVNEILQVSSIPSSLEGGDK
jgi:hypothetical protein